MISHPASLQSQIHPQRRLPPRIQKEEVEAEGDIVALVPVPVQVVPVPVPVVDDKVLANLKLT